MILVKNIEMFFTKGLAVHLKYTLLFYALFCCFSSCQAQDYILDRDSEPQQGLVYVKEYGKKSVFVPIDYAPEGRFIQAAVSQNYETRYWFPFIQIFQDEQRFMPKEFRVGEDEFALYDSLQEDDYTALYVSLFKDTVRVPLHLQKSLTLGFPLELEQKYKELPFDEFDVHSLSTGDTLQILYRYFGCFHMRIKLYEFIFSESSVSIRTAPLRENSWTVLNLDNPRDILSQFLEEAKEYNGIQGCSSHDMYFLRVKNKDVIYKIDDGSCTWDGVRLFKEG